MKTSLRQGLCKAFGYESYPEFRAMLKMPVRPYPVTLTWKCIAKGRRKDPFGCIITEQLNEDSSVDVPFTIRNFTYIRFKEDKYIYRYKNSAELVNVLDEFDEWGRTDAEEGDVHILEAPDAARSLEYAMARREGIRNGTWEVKPRGPNTNMRRKPRHHFRPF